MRNQDSRLLFNMVMHDKTSMKAIFENKSSNKVYQLIKKIFVKVVMMYLLFARENVPL